MNESKSNAQECGTTPCLLSQTCNFSSLYILLTRHQIHLTGHRETPLRGSNFSLVWLFWNVMTISCVHWWEKKKVFFLLFCFFFCMPLCTLFCILPCLAGLLVVLVGCDACQMLRLSVLCISEIINETMRRKKTILKTTLNQLLASVRIPMSILLLSSVQLAFLSECTGAGKLQRCALHNANMHVCPPLYMRIAQCPLHCLHTVWSGHECMYMQVWPTLHMRSGQSSPLPSYQTLGKVQQSVEA